MTEYYSALHWAKKSEKFANNSKSEAELAAQYAVASRPLGIKNITNCLTSIPQDIKLELKDGVLTLKAGSKVYVPYGTENLTDSYPVGSTFLNDNFKVVHTSYSYNKFFVGVEVQNDIVRSQSSSSAVYNRFLSINISANNTGAYINAYSGAGSFDTSGSVKTLTYYQTDTNLIKFIDSAVIAESIVSLPIMIVTSDTTNLVASIDQVFNGFGYIGSTIYALPGVKGLIPNGVNEDGSLKNIEFTVGTVVTQTITGSFTNMPFVVNDGAIQWIDYLGEFSTPPAVQQYKGYFNPMENKMYFAITTDGWTQIGRAFAGRVSSNGVITSFTPKTAFHAVNYDDVNSSVPTGTIFPFAGDKAPSGFYLCDGSEKSRITDAILFAVIGEKFGAGDGSTTFNLPLLTDNRFLEGSTTAGTQKNAGLPNITGTFGNTTMRNDSKSKFNTTTGAFAGTSSTASTGYGTDTTSQTGKYVVNFSATRSSSIYGGSSTVQPKSLTCLYIIKR